MFDTENYINRFPSYLLIIISIFFLEYSSITFSQVLSAEQIYEKVNDAVVVILAYNYENKLSKQGSGVVLNDKGYVVTNYHVLFGCKRLEIQHRDKNIPYVDIIGVDKDKDILILKIDDNKFPSIKLGDVKKLKVGQRVFAIGSPLGFENTISEGIISGLRKYEETNKNYIQITASISPGSSGGAVVNDQGALVGISTSSVVEGQNLNFAIPIDEVLNVEIGSYSPNKEIIDFSLFKKATVALENGNYKDAIMYLNSIIADYPDYYYAYVNRGYAKGFLGDYDGEIQDYNKAIELNPNDAHTYYNRGITKLNNLENYTSAIQDFNIVLKIDPTYVSAYANRGIAKYQLGDTYGACSDWSKAGELGYDEVYELIREYCNQ